MVIEGAMSGEIFLAYVEQCLVPTLRRNDIIVMDNYRAHKVPGIREAIEKVRATVRYLPNVLARPQSHRNALQQIQSIAAQGRRADCSGSLPNNSLVRAPPWCSRMR
jgi:transposase